MDPLVTEILAPEPLTQVPPVGTAYSSQRDPYAAARELAVALRHPELGFVLFFCSAEYSLTTLGDAMSEAFGGVALCGCTTAGEITPAGYCRGCIVAIGFDCRAFAISHVLITDLEGFDLLQAQRLTSELLETCRQASPALERGGSFALTLLDGLSSSEEQVLATLDTALGSIPSFGGSAGDDNRLAHTHVYSDGRFHSEAAVVVMFRTRLPFDVFTTHHLRAREEKLVVTRADRERRRVLELNAAPAAEEYARLVGLPVAALESDTFARHPLAVRIGDQHYVRSIQSVNADGSLSFYCAVENGIVLTAMQPAPLLDDLQATLQGLRERLGEPVVVIGCDCFLRRLELEALAQVDEASRLLGWSRVVGFNTYGEQLHGMHINQTFTGVAIGSCPPA
ncbi:nitric oxide-sensing protein NosP [Billgrantia endophytica]|uniref:GfdT protein n=1 Tax=Billgrantia endophytica TaxID=2033802 RepID=A0A2N7TYK3_9GAMM|nr:nitric oxide-sensing protein NosP [Halomonas endophytica]PMR73259.1 GfdT protein [Halomonas endophytica]